MRLRLVVIFQATRCRRFSLQHFSKMIEPLLIITSRNYEMNCYSTRILVRRIWYFKDSAFFYYSVYILRMTELEFLFYIYCFLPYTLKPRKNISVFGGTALKRQQTLLNSQLQNCNYSTAQKQANHRTRFKRRANAFAFGTKHVCVCISVWAIRNHENTKRVVVRLIYNNITLLFCDEYKVHENRIKN